MSDTDASFPPSYPKLPLPTTLDAINPLAYLTRLVTLLNDYEDHDLHFEAPGVSYAIAHTLARTPAYYEVVWADTEVTIFADTASGWGYNVVYFQSNAAARIRIRLR